jgi:hypothetical protein
MNISDGEFDRQFERFKLSVRLASGAEFKSFHEGIAASWEDYKPRLRKCALSLLDASNWSEASIGRGRILPKVISSIEIADRDLPNNLVRWENRWGPDSQSHNAMLDAVASGRGIREFEREFFSLFRSHAVDAESFEQLRSLTGNKYDLLAYLFFLKDSKQYMPIATQTFDKAFRLLGSDLVTARHCSWENYRRYNAVLTQVQQALRDRAGIRGARLIDAHSFCWMLVRIEKELLNGSIESATRSSLQEDQVNVCITQMADTVEQTVANSNSQIVNRISKEKRLLMSRQELEALIARRLVSQQKRCALTGIAFQFPGNGCDTQLLPSVDRIDSDGHYGASNIQLVCRFVNHWKSDSDDAEFRRLLALARQSQ